MMMLLFQISFSCFDVCFIWFFFLLCSYIYI